MAEEEGSRFPYVFWGSKNIFGLANPDDVRNEGASAMGQMFRLTTLQDNTITTSLQYANGQITLNGQKMPLEDFVGMFAMPALNVPVVPALPQQ